ncbi:unnamed protein product, partial [Pocillopora meandrina]
MDVSMEDSIRSMAILEDPSPEGCQPTFEPQSFGVDQDASKRVGDILVNSREYSYTNKYSGKSGINWHCTKRGKVASCKAHVKQCGAEFVIGPINHNHEPKTGVSMVAKISKEVNKRAMEDVFKSASVIIIEVMLENMDQGPCSALPKVDYMAWTANKSCQKSRPKYPNDFDFEIAEHILDDFLLGDVMERVIEILPTEEQVKESGARLRGSNMVVGFLL